MLWGEGRSCYGVKIVVVMEMKDVVVIKGRGIVVMEMRGVSCMYRWVWWMWCCLLIDPFLPVLVERPSSLPTGLSVHDRRLSRSSAEWNGKSALSEHKENTLQPTQVSDHYHPPPPPPASHHHHYTTITPPS